MNLLNFKNAQDFLEKTGLTIEECLSVVEEELNKLKKEEKEGGKNMKRDIMKKYALCDDCKNPIKSIFDMYDYVDEKMIEHTVCHKCLKKWIGKVGAERAEKLVIKLRREM